MLNKSKLENVLKTLSQNKQKWLGLDLQKKYIILNLRWKNFYWSQNVGQRFAQDTREMNFILKLLDKKLL